MTWDAVVVGGGPAGSAFAARVARLGHRVLVLDRAEFPRRKPCGECVNPAAVAALDALGALSAVEAQAHSELRAWRISGAGGERFEGAFPDGVGGFAMPRETLDAVLLAHARAAGAEVRTGAHVVDLVREGGQGCGVVVEHPGGEAEAIRARLVAGADGLRSVVLRRLNLLRRSPRLRKIALTAHVRGLPPLGGYGELRVEENGCVGIAEVGGGLCNVTVVVTGDAGREMRGHPAGYFDAALARHGFADARRVDEVLATGPFDWPVRRAVADGALLVGDAAGYYDPFTGQGIFRALRGAELAAETADAALRAGDTSAAALAPYERARRRAFASGERMQHVVEAFVSRPPLLRAVAVRFARHPALADALIRVTGDVAPAGSLLRPSILALLLA